MINGQAFIRVTRTGFELDYYLPIAPGIYFSNLNQLRIKIDGIEIDKKDIRIVKNNIEVPIKNISILSSYYWAYHEPVEIVNRNYCRLSYGLHEVRIDLTYSENISHVSERYREVTITETTSRIVINGRVE